MKNNRRNFLKKAGITGLSISGILALPGFSYEVNSKGAVIVSGSASSGPMDDILLKDWQPSSSVIVKETLIKKAMYPAIDVHSHNYDTSPDNIARRVKNMDEVGLETAVILSSATGEKFDKLAELYLKKYPGRFLLYGLNLPASVLEPMYRGNAKRVLNWKV